MRAYECGVNQNDIGCSRVRVLGLVDGEEAQLGRGNHTSIFFKALLLVVLDSLRWTNLRLVGIITELSKCSALAQEIPALVELNFQLSETVTVVAGKFAPSVKLLLFLHKLIDVVQYRLISILSSHLSLFQGSRLPLLSESIFANLCNFIPLDAPTGESDSLAQGEPKAQDERSGHETSIEEATDPRGNYGSPGSGGVVLGGTRWCVACSYE